MSAGSTDAILMDVSRETREKLVALDSLTERWTRKINLVSKSTIPDIWTRHIRDSIQVFSAAPEGWSTWVDLGSGGGFPGLVVAILARPDQSVTLVESDQRKCTFLRTARRELDIAAEVICDRIEHIENRQFDVVSARALAPLDQLLAYAHPLLAPRGTCIFPKGASHQDEIEAARRNWAFDHEALHSMTQEDARILRLKGLTRRGS